MSGKRDWGRGFAHLVATGVGAAAGYVSWQHLRALGVEHGATPEAAWLTPFTIDGMIVVGTLELRQARREGRPAKPWGYGAVLLGVFGTIAGNVAAARSGDLTARLYFAAPAAAFLVSIEVLFGKPLTRNLWELIAQGWASRKAARAARRDRPFATGAASAARVTGTALTEPQPQTAPPTTLRLVPGNLPPEAMLLPAQQPAERLATPVRPERPAKHRQAAQGSAGRRGKGSGFRGQTMQGHALDDLTGKVVGNRTVPARLVDGVVLSSDELKADARRRLAEALAGGRTREGLGSWVARQYDPPMSPRWGQQVLAAMGDLAGQPPEQPAWVAPGDGTPFVGPLPVAEQAEPLPDHQPARV